MTGVTGKVFTTCNDHKSMILLGDHEAGSNRIWLAGRPSGTLKVKASMSDGCLQLHEV